MFQTQPGQRVKDREEAGIIENVFFEWQCQTFSLLGLFSEKSTFPLLCLYLGGHLHYGTNHRLWSPEAR